MVQLIGKPRMFAIKEPEVLEGFTAVNDQIFLRPADTDATVNPALSHPTVVLIYGWGDGPPHQVGKYAAKYRAMYPGTRIIVVLSPIRKIFASTLDQRVAHMAPVINAVFAGSVDPKAHDRERVLLHVMSNSGGINAAATYTAYRRRFKATLPHQLCICDSMPSSDDLLAHLGRWSRAMALGAARVVPLPFVVVQAVAALMLVGMQLSCRVRGEQSPATYSTRVFNDPRFTNILAERLYLYSKEDELVPWKDIETDVAKAKEVGYKATVEVFEGSGHVGHMKLNPEKYWNAINRAWVAAAEGRQDRPRM